MEKEERFNDLKSLLYHISAELIEEYIDPSAPASDLRYLAGISEIKSLTSNNAIKLPEFVIIKEISQFKQKPDRYAVMSKLSNGSYLVVSSDTHNIDKNLQHLSLRLYLLFLLAITISTLLFYFFLRKLLLPLEALADACHHIDLSKNNLHLPPICDSSVEIEQLGSAMQTLVDRIAYLRNKEHEMFKEAAHQIKTPLAILKARLDHYSLDEQLSKEKFLVQANGDIAKLLKYLKELLLVHQSQIADQQSKESLNMLSFMQEVVGYIKPLLQRKEQSVVLSGDKVFTVQSYKPTLMKLVLTIIENCINHAPSNSVITITLEPLDSKISFANEVAKDFSPALFNSNLGLKIIRELSSSLDIAVTFEQTEDLFTLSLTYM